MPADTYDHAVGSARWRLSQPRADCSAQLPAFPAGRNGSPPSARGDDQRVSCSILAIAGKVACVPWDAQLDDASASTSLAIANRRQTSSAHRSHPQVFLARRSRRDRATLSVGSGIVGMSAACARPARMRGPPASTRSASTLGKPFSRHAPRAATRPRAGIHDRMSTSANCNLLRGLSSVSCLYCKTSDTKKRSLVFYTFFRKFHFFLKR